MKILIVGGFGFLGGRLARFFFEAGHSIALGSARHRDAPEWLPEAEVVPVTWNDYEDLNRICATVDVLIHAAGLNARDCQKNPSFALEYNGVFSSNLARAAANSGVKKFIYLSTAHVYSDLLSGHITDDTCPMNLHPYATTHLAGEQASLHACSKSYTSGIVLRLTNCFGSPVHKDANCWTLLANDLCKQAVVNGSLKLTSNGCQLRDFVSVDKLCKDIEVLIQPSFKIQGAFNLSEGKSLSVLQFAEQIQVVCEKLNGFIPQIHVNKHDEAEYARDLKIVPSDMIRQLGNMSDYKQELTKLLKYCKTMFGKK